MIHSAEPLAEPARAYIGSMPAGDWFLFDMAPLDVTGVPAWKAVLIPDDPAAAGAAMQHGTSYGATHVQAIVAAVAECFEEVSVRHGVAAMPRVEGSYRALVAERGAAGSPIR